MSMLRLLLALMAKKQVSRTASYRGRYTGTSASGGTTTFTGVDLGDARSSRLVFVFFISGDNKSETAFAATINGVTATTDSLGVGISPLRLDIAYAVVPSGTTGIDIVSSASGVSSGAARAALVFTTDTDSNAAIDNVRGTNFDNNTTAIVLNDVAVKPNGTQFWAAVATVASVTHLAAWNGVDTVVESYEGVGINTVYSLSCGFIETTEDDGTHDLTVTPSANSARGVIAISFGAPS